MKRRLLPIGGRRVVAGLLAVGAVLLGASGALATTGATPLAHPPKYRISKRQAAPFTGVFQMRHRSGLLISAGLAQRFNEGGFYEGTLEVYQYYREMESSWVGTTYEYRIEDGKLHVDVFSPNGQGTPLLARMVLTARGKRLTGTLHIVHPRIPQVQHLSLVRVRR